MASLLKRKRGTDGDAVSPKQSQTPNVASWDVAFMQSRADALVKRSESLGERSDLERKELKKTKKPQWRLSPPIGGRIIGVDPVLSKDEKYLIIGLRNSLQVYATADSLLTRSIQLEIDYAVRPTTTKIVSFALSPTNADLVWVACSDGAVYLIDWRHGTGTADFWTASSTGIACMTVAALESKGRKRDVVLTTERRREDGYRITAHELTAPGSAIATVAKTVFTSSNEIQILTAHDGVIVAAARNKLVLGNLRSADFGTIDKIAYDFRSFETSDYIGSLDVRISPRAETKSKADKYPVVDVVLGDVRGVIFLHRDLLANLVRAQSKPGNLTPSKLHWHRNAVHSVKWSLDGNYLISGGGEAVMVIWQLDTSKKQFLPYLGATIDNIAVSPSGSSYILHLADNSVMVLSTAELKPTAHVAGVQAQVLETAKPLESRITRLAEETLERPLMQRVPSAINPAEPSNLMLAVGEKQEVNPFATVLLNTPFLQTFDIASNRHVSRQALARTNITNSNFAPDTFRLSEPQTTHLQVSHDGQWLATVDMWEPPKRDLEYLAYPGGDVNDERQRRREVYLKFWQRTDDGWELVARIDAPHLSTAPGVAGKVLDLAADPSTTMFATIGEDRSIRTWIPKTRTRDGVPVRSKDGDPLFSWKARHTIAIGNVELEDDADRHRWAAHAAISFADDGSMLAAALAGCPDGRVYFIDPTAGTIHHERSGLYRGDILRLELAQQYLVTLATDLRVYDLVQDELMHGIRLGDAVHLLSLEQKREMAHLAVDRARGTLAVALPWRADWKRFEKTQVGSIMDAVAELAVFALDRGTPLLATPLPALVTALLPARDPAAPGFVLVDANADIRGLAPKASMNLLALAKATADLRLDPAPDAEDHNDNEEMDEEMDLAAPDELLPADEDDDGPPVVTAHQLSAVFDVGPPFALPPVETLFYQVADLFSVKPVARGVA